MASYVASGVNLSFLCLAGLVNCFMMMRMMRRMMAAVAVLSGLGLWSGCDQQPSGGKRGGGSDAGRDVEAKAEQTPKRQWQERLQAAAARAARAKDDDKQRVEALNEEATLYAEGLQKGWVHPLDVRAWCDAAAAAGAGYSGETVLGVTLLYGIGVPRNPEMAVEWLERGLERPGSQRGNARYMLGLMYSKGDGVLQDVNKALDYWNKAADDGNPGALFQLGRASLDGSLGMREDVASGIALLEQAANKGSQDASMLLGRMYARGNGVEQDMERAMKWYGQAAAAGNAHAQYILGMACLEGAGVPVDERKAFSWLQMAAGQEHVDAMMMLSACYSTGKGTSQDADMAAVWKQKAIMLHNKRSQGSPASAGETP